MMRRVDLLPPAYLRRRKERSNLVIAAVAIGVVMLLLVGWWFLLGMKVNDAEESLAEVQAQNAELNAEIAELQRFVDLENEVRAKRQSLQTVMAGDVDWPGLLAEIAMVLPGEVWLTNLTGSAGTTEGFTQAPTETSPIPISDSEPFGRIQFQGESLSMPGIAKWMVRLEGVESFFAVYLQSAVESDSVTGVKTFTFDSSLELGGKAASGRHQGRVGE